MPRRAALATSAGKIRAIVELLRIASRNDASGSRDLPSDRALAITLANFVNWFKSNECNASDCKSRPIGPAEFPKDFNLAEKSCGARGSHCNSEYSDIISEIPSLIFGRLKCAVGSFIRRRLLGPFL